MKKLQNNFTTTEQSKRLLELGVPASSADCYFYTKVDKHPKILTTDKFDWLESPYIPCWSVGRLMGIFDICYQRGLDEECITESWILTQEAEENFSSYIEYLVETFEIQQDYLDFSKLDE